MLSVSATEGHMVWPRYTSSASNQDWQEATGPKGDQRTSNMPPKQHSSLEPDESNTWQKQTIFSLSFSYLFTCLFWTPSSCCTKPDDLQSSVPHHRSLCEDWKWNSEEFPGRNRNLEWIMQSAGPSNVTSFCMRDTCCQYANARARLNNCWMHIQSSLCWQSSSVFSFIYFYTYLHLPHRCLKALHRALWGLDSNPSNICLSAFVYYSIETVFYSERSR